MAIQVEYDHEWRPVSPRFCRDGQAPEPTRQFCESLDGRSVRRLRSGERTIELAARPRPVQEYVLR